MSQWIDLDGHIATPKPYGEAAGVMASIPTGSESGPLVDNYQADRWLITGSLRDMSEEDVPEVRDWFVSACQQLSATEAELEISGHRWCYVYELLPDGIVRLRPRIWDSEAWS